jgi:hypothetical protein
MYTFQHFSQMIRKERGVARKAHGEVSSEVIVSVPPLPERWFASHILLSRTLALPVPRQYCLHARRRRCGDVRGQQTNRHEEVTEIIFGI